jgi:hypothetical protein
MPLKYNSRDNYLAKCRFEAPEELLPVHLASLTLA